MAYLVFMKDWADVLELCSETNSNYQLVFQVIVQLSVVPEAGGQKTIRSLSHTISLC